MLQLKDRVLYRDGTSLVSDEFACEHLIDTGSLQGIRLLPSDDATLYEQYYHEVVDATKFSDECPIVADGDVAQYELDVILDAIENARDSTEWSEHFDRIMVEMEYFERHKKLRFLYALTKLIEQFRHDGLVWGGRGSSCASYVLYLIGVHDTNPIKYKIPFSEFSKEQEV